MTEGQFNHRLGARTGSIHDADTSSTGRCQVDVVNTDPCTTDHFEPVAGDVEHFGRKFGCTSDDDGIEGFQCSGEKIGGIDVLQHDLVSSFLKPLNGLFIHSIGHGDSGHARWLFRGC